MACCLTVGLFLNGVDLGADRVWSFGWLKLLFFYFLNHGRLSLSSGVVRPIHFALKVPLRGHKRVTKTISCQPASLFFSQRFLNFLFSFGGEIHDLNSVDSFFIVAIPPHLLQLLEGIIALFCLYFLNLSIHEVNIHTLIVTFPIRRISLWSMICLLRTSLLLIFR